MRNGACLGAVLVFLGSGLAAQDGAEPLTGRVDVGARYYFDDGLYAGQSPRGAYGFVGLRLETGARAGAGEISFAFSGLLEQENGRSFANLERLFYRQSFGTWDLIAGVNTENWSVVESVGVVNVMNPADNADPVSGAGLLGTPMINANLYTGAGTFSAYLLAGFVEPNTPGPENRFRAPILPDFANPIFEEGNGRHADLALRYSGNFRLGEGSLDIGASYFDGTSRSPVCTAVGGTGAGSCYDAVIAALGAPPGSPAPGSSSDAFWDWMAANATDALVSGASAVPVPGLGALYQRTRQVGLTAVFAHDDLQLKAEGSWSRAGGRTYFAGVAGGDYTWHNLFGTDHGMTLAVEYLYDGRDAAQGTPLFEDDVFLGLSYRLNNRLDTAFSLSVIHDLSSSAQYITAGVTSRINDRLSFEVKGTHIETDGYNDPLSFIGRDSFLEVSLSTFF